MDSANVFHCCHLAVVLILILRSIPRIEMKTVTIKDGTLEGSTKRVEGKDVHTFLGIPFAKPPIGDLRFRKPVAVEPWNDTYKATEYSAACPQMLDDSFDKIPAVEQWNPEVNLSEDCLYLNVWTPDMDPAELKVVMVWIYGGGLTTGATSLDLYNGELLAVREDIVLVSLQYRLGTFGFLYLGQEEAPGNMGLMDQQMAIKWVHDNIAKFGGDPDKVTLFGESAGSFSVGMHLLSPGSQPLFKYAIMQSGSPLSPWGYKEPDAAKDISMKIVDKVGCKLDSAPEIIQCMDSVEVAKLVEAGITADPDFSRPPATLDGTFINESPRSLLQTGTFKNTSILIGANAEEGHWFLLYTFPKLFPDQHKPQSFSKENFTTVLKGTVLGSVSDQPAVITAVEFEYMLQKEDLGIDYLNLADRVHGDVQITCPVVSFSDTFAKYGRKVYYYYLDHRADNHPWPKWMGTVHGHDIDYIFGFPYFPFNKEDENFSKRVQRYWANFAKTGDPGGDWPLYASPNYTVNFLDTKPTHTANRLLRRRCAFWNEYVPSLIQSLEAGKCVSSASLPHFQVALVLISAWMFKFFV